MKNGCLNQRNPGLEGSEDGRVFAVQQWEDQAAKISVEEQMLITTIQTFEKDLDLAKSETRRVKKEPDQMVKTKGQLCSQILEKQKNYYFGI